MRNSDNCEKWPCVCSLVAFSTLIPQTATIRPLFIEYMWQRKKTKQKKETNKQKKRKKTCSLFWPEAAGSAEWIHKALLVITSESWEFHRRSAYMVAACHHAGWGGRGGACHLARPLPTQRESTGHCGLVLTDSEGFAVWFSSWWSIDSFKVESTCHRFNHPWPRLHVGGAQRGGTGSAGPVPVHARVRWRAVERNRKIRRQIDKEDKETLKPKEIRVSICFVFLLFFPPNFSTLLSSKPCSSTVM